MTIIKDSLAILLVFYILYEPSISNWWIIFSIIVLAGNYSIKDKNNNYEKTN